MQRGKHERQKYHIIELYAVLILIATLFMGIAYAEISGVILEIEGTAETTIQEGVFIANVVNLSSTEANITDSKINYFLGTMLDSKIVLGNTTQSVITYEVIIHNNTDKEQLFIDILYENNNYSNTNIEVSLESIGDLAGIEKYVTTIAPNATISFPITFKYKEGANLNNNILESKLNFRFKEKPILKLNNENETYILQGIYPDYEPQSYEFTVTNYNNEQEINVVPISYYFDITIDKPLSAKIYDENGNEVIGNINLDGNGVQQVIHKYTLEIVWDNSNTEGNISYDSIEYVNKQFDCKISLKAMPEDDKYLNMILIKEFDININSSDYRKTFNILYVNITNNNYPKEIENGKNLEITFIDSIPVELEVTGCESYTYNSPILKIENATGDLVVKNPTGDILVFERKEQYTFSGSNFLNTEIILFNQENIDKDFEISCDIVSYGNRQEDYATLVNSLYENTPYAGILLRIRNNRYEIVAQQEPDNIHYAELSEITNFKYIRRDGIVYYKINDGDEVEIQSFQGFTDYFNTPVTFGGSLDADGNPYRYFNGIITNMSIRVFAK